MDRAFVESDSGNTTCVWKAPSEEDLKALFEKAGVELLSVTPVDEVVSGEFS